MSGLFLAVILFIIVATDQTTDYTCHYRQVRVPREIHNVEF